MSKANWLWLRKLRDVVRNAFALEGPHGGLTEADYDLLDKLARGIVVRGMATPALLFLRSVRPLNSLGSQALVFLRPFLTPLLRETDYDRMAAILERRESIGALVGAIEAAGAAGKEEAR